ncbi:MAG: hypothetical protein V3V84_00630 [Candidatus Bathyarchaeia archaeon]
MWIDPSIKELHRKRSAYIVEILQKRDKYIETYERKPNIVYLSKIAFDNFEQTMDGEAYLFPLKRVNYGTGLAFGSMMIKVVDEKDFKICVEYNENFGKSYDGF